MGLNVTDNDFIHGTFKKTTNRKYFKKNECTEYRNNLRMTVKKNTKKFRNYAIVSNEKMGLLCRFHYRERLISTESEVVDLFTKNFESVHRCVSSEVSESSPCEFKVKP